MDWEFSIQYVMNSELNGIVSSVFRFLFLLNKSRGSLVIGHMFKKCFWNVCYKYVS
jgi:hypothetical protein